MSKPILFSFFSGSGFLDLGFEKSGFDVQYVNEFHKPFLDAYKYSRSSMGISEPQFGYSNESIEELVEGDLKESFLETVNNAKKQNELIGFIGGPPCPDFSVAGKNKGKDGENGRLTQVYVNGIIKFSPDFFIFENVKGLWRTARHREFFEKVKLELEEAGYILTNRLTNCIEYGAPQDRDRILLFGIKKSKSNSKNNEQLEMDFNWQSELKYDRNLIFQKIEWPTRDIYKENGEKTIPTEIKKYEELTVEYWFNKNNVNAHPNSKHHFVPRAALPKFQVIDEGDDSKKSFKRLHRWRYSPTAAYGNNEVHLHPYKSRRLSAAEALAIQSLPKDFSFPDTMTLSNMFKTIGNGVPYVASLGLARTVKKYLDSFTH
ncbi:DNA cytosine methyltransferase [Psychromonas sp. MME2]|uniref:DNA cytosine methyltransferase n=1 Tax=unclassified Psychromonas TaxID=2614957 RepID=UPI00339C9330